MTASNKNPFVRRLFAGLLGKQEAGEAGGDRSPSTREIEAHFDRAFYLAEYPDVARAGVDPFAHFCEYGWREGRNPSSRFNTRYYQERYGDQIPFDTNPLQYYAAVGAARGDRTSPVGTKRWPKPKAPNEAEWDKVLAAAQSADIDVSVIIPVYRGYDDTLAALHSVLAHRQRARFNLIVINDCSPEPELTTKLRELAQRELFIYLENEQNLGFIGTVNRGLAYCPETDVILLNSDTLVFGDWIDRLLAHAQSDATVATITPLSNNATICSYPDDNKSNPMTLECSLEQLDAYAKACNGGRSVAIPTGVGFCFFIRRSVIKLIGALDPAFGRGYGEENDFCMRAIKAGYKNILAQDVFVFHSGAVSFAEIFEGEFTQGQKLLAEKHPDYQRRVAGYVHSGKGRPGRARLDLYRQAQALGPRTAVLVTMQGSGGVPDHVNHLSQRWEDAGVAVVHAVLKGDVVSLQPFDLARECYMPSASKIDLNFQGALLEDFLDWLNPEIVHVHSLATATWRAAKQAIEIFIRRSPALYVTLHDYDPLCFRHNLVDREGVPCLNVTQADCRACIALDEAAVNRCDPIERLESWGALLQAAQRVFVPSEDTRRRFSAVYPELSFDVRPHEEELQPFEALARPTSSERIDLVAIGAIGPHKGADILHALALDARLRELPLRYHIVGYSAITEDMKSVGIIESGRYATTEQCVDALRKVGPSFALILSIWPETYCYTLSIALALGLPPIVFDLGAQADRVRAAGFGVVFDRELRTNPQAINDAILRLSVTEEWSKVRPVEFSTYNPFPDAYCKA